MKKTRDVTDEYRRAEAAAQQVDFVRQYGIPDIERLLRAAWQHGYVAALLQHSGEGE